MRKLPKLSRKVINYERSEPDEPEPKSVSDIAKDQILITLLIALGISITSAAYFHNRLVIAESQGRNAVQSQLEYKNKLINNCER